MIRYSLLIFAIFNNYQAFSSTWGEGLAQELEEVTLPQIMAKPPKIIKKRSVGKIENINLESKGFQVLPLASDNNNLELLFDDQKAFEKL